MARLALGLIRLYQNTVSRVLPHACRFQPTCSHYAVEAIKKYGLIRGSRMAANRIIRCNPFTEGGYDPVP
jgi:putative membrane protein insertion efficiency factor